MPELQGLPLPPAVSQFPETLAWKVLLIFLLCLLICFLFYLLRRHRRRLWRRQTAQITAENTRADEWFLLIRRVCVLHMAREEVIRLSDSALLDQITELAPPSRHALLKAHYSSADLLDTQINAQVRVAVRNWIKELPDV